MKKFPDDFWSSVDIQVMITCAHRYALGRKTYVVSSFIDWATKYHQYLENNTVYVIVRDTIEAVNDDNAGHQTIDMPEWKKLVKNFYQKLPPDYQNQLLQYFRNSEPWFTV